MPHKKRQTWLGYIEALSAEEFNQQRSALKTTFPLILPQIKLQGFLQHSIPAIYVVDYLTGNYLVMSDGCHQLLGYHPEDFLEGGLEFMIQKYHPDDLRIYNEQVFTDRLEMLKTIPPAEHNQYMFSYTFRLKNKKGAYNSLLQRNCFIQSDENGNPLLSMGIAINVDHHCPLNPVVQKIEKISPDLNTPPKLVDKKYYFLHEEDRLFSMREKEVLKWTSEGLTHKEIADKLFISEGTVHQHRKNMLQKSNTANVGQLIAFAVRQGII